MLGLFLGKKPPQTTVFSVALAVAGLAADGETVIDGAEAASVTYPDFIRDFQNIGADFTVIQ